MATKNFKINDRVKIIFSTYDKDGNEGAFGTIIKKGVQRYDWIVRVEFPGTQSDDLGFNSDELELVEEEVPAPAVKGSVKPVEEFPTEYTRGWDSATQSMLDILERLIANPTGGNVKTHLKALVKNMRETYPQGIKP